MTKNESNIESVLNTDSLTECRPVAQFVGYLPQAATALNYEFTNVSLHCRDDSAVVVVEHGHRRDTAFCGDLDDAHAAVVRLARHADADVFCDDFDVLTAANEAEQAGENQ